MSSNSQNVTGFQSVVNRGKGKNQDEARRRQKAKELRKIRGPKMFYKYVPIRNKEFKSDIGDKLPSLTYLRKLSDAAGDSTKPEQQLIAVQSARKLLSSDKNVVINDFITSGLLHVLVDCLKENDHTMLQFEATWAVTNIASGTSEQTKAVVAAGAVPLLVQLLSSPAPNVYEQAIWALGNIIGDGPQMRDFAIEQGVIKPLLAFVKCNIPTSCLHNINWVIVNLCRNNDPSAPAEAIREILSALNIMVQHTETDILSISAWAVSHITDGGHDHIKMVFESGIVPKLITLLDHDVSKIQLAAMRAIGNIIVRGTDEHTQMILNYDALTYFPNLLSHEKEKVRKEGLWFISNVMAGNQVHVQEVIDNDLLRKIIENLQHGAYNTQREAAWAVSNLTITGNYDQVLTLIKEGAITPFCNMLSCDDPQIIIVVLDGLSNMLKIAKNEAEEIAYLIEDCDGLDKIEKLQNHENPTIYKAAYDLMDEVEQATLSPRYDGSQSI